MVTVAEPIVNPLAMFGDVPVPRLWPDSTIVCIGSGPSLTRPDVEYCRGRARVIAIKNVIELAPWADVLYGAGKDAGGMTWWRREGPKLKCAGLRYTLDPNASEWASVLEIAGHDGLSTDPSGLCSGGHSGYQAINLAVHLGARRIVLLGYDMRPNDQGRDHYFGSHPHRMTLPFRMFLKRFPAIDRPLKDLGIEVLNASRSTALNTFRQCSLREALPA